METFFLVDKNLKNYADNKFIVTDKDVKNKIITALKIKNLNPNDYIFYNETDLITDSTFFKKYIDSILNINFPTSWDSKTSQHVYYPEIKKIENNKSTVYVHRWDNISIPPKTKTIRYINDNSDKEENQRVLLIHHEKI